ncbi:arsenate reductase ArsC [Arhodomonas sp. SL1]|uniref:arsenate reductase ArsC n=1 Tax=Arhodomonas sp. SL1 TaxID=3425691 RepID=UPI003F882D82
MDEQPHYHVLFLCTGNSARSQFAEVILNTLGRGRFTAYSAGSHPEAAVHPQALTLLEAMSLPTAGLYPKSWEEFTGPQAPSMDFVFTVCDRAAREPCPVWPGQPMTAHWGIEDPVRSIEPPEKAFRRAFYGLRNRVSLFLNLPLTSLDRMRLQRELDAIGRDDDGGDA